MGQCCGMERRATMTEEAKGGNGEKDDLLERKDKYEVKEDTDTKDQKPSVSATSLHNSEVSQN